MADTPAHRPYIDVLVAALMGGEDDVVEAVSALDRRALSRLHNTLNLIQQRVTLREARLKRGQA